MQTDPVRCSSVHPSLLTVLTLRHPATTSPRFHAPVTTLITGLSPVCLELCSGLFTDLLAFCGFPAPLQLPHHSQTKRTQWSSVLAPGSSKPTHGCAQGLPSHGQCFQHSRSWTLCLKTFLLSDNLEPKYWDKLGHFEVERTQALSSNRFSGCEDRPVHKCEILSSWFQRRHGQSRSGNERKRQRPTWTRGTSSRRGHRAPVEGQAAESHGNTEFVWKQRKLGKQGSDKEPS